MKDMNNSNLLIDAYCEFTVGWDDETQSQTIKIDKQIGDNTIFQDILRENAKIGCLVTSNDRELVEENKADFPLIAMVSYKNDLNPDIGDIIYQRQTDDCYFHKSLSDFRFAVLVYCNLKHKHIGLYMALCQGLLDADLDAFIYLHDR